MDPDVTDVADADPGKRVLAAVAILASVVIALLSGLQIHLDNQEQRANLLAARHIGRLHATISGSSSLTSFATQTKLTSTDLSIRGLARRYVAVGSGAAGDVARVQGRADEAASVQTDRLAASMARPPTAASGVDAATRAALTATPADWAALVAEENRLVDRAERAGARADLAVVGLILAAVASALLSLAGSLEAARPNLGGVGGIFLAVGVCVGALALIR
jgi:hypothetical protein